MHIDTRLNKNDYTLMSLSMLLFIDEMLNFRPKSGKGEMYKTSCIYPWHLLLVWVIHLVVAGLNMVRTPIDTP